MITKEFPHAVAGANDHLVIGLQGKFLDVWYRIDSHTGRHWISKGSSHGEAWYIFAFEPDAQRANLMAEDVAEAVDATAISYYMSGFFGIIRFVIFT